MTKFRVWLKLNNKRDDYKNLGHIHFALKGLKLKRRVRVATTLDGGIDFVTMEKWYPLWWRRSKGRVVLYQTYLDVHIHHAFWQRFENNYGRVLKMTKKCELIQKKTREWNKK